jgi:hypothetical protein
MEAEASAFTDEVIQHCSRAGLGLGGTGGEAKIFLES